ncbi:MAG: hypothetical protein BAJALOKI1v1_700015 [Promethearchaeota archaeon]|nr:MAG: hypothetical protein BAJALOKI1v1_700015 [Candidatus Lokiarchaeota archaeon]
MGKLILIQKNDRYNSPARIRTVVAGFRAPHEMPNGEDPS